MDKDVYAAWRLRTVPRWAHTALTGMLLFLICALEPRRRLMTRRL